MKRRVIIIEEDDEKTNDPNIVNVPFVKRQTNPIDRSWVCPYCGKRVYSMEVHPCNQPYC